MLWLALQFPHLGLEVHAQEIGGDDSGRPVVLLEDNRVRLGNRAASAAGIQTGATLATAHSIAGDLVHFQRDLVREEKRLGFIAEALYRFSAQVSLEQPDALVLEIGSSLALFGDAGHLRLEAQALCAELGHRAQTALAGTPAAALAMATASVGRLEAVPLAQARLPSVKHLERLANMGLRTLGALIALPEVELGRRFGQEMVDYLARLTGRLPDPRAGIELKARFDQALHLLEPVRDKAGLLDQPGTAATPDTTPMTRLLTELEIWLVSHQLGAEQLVWSFSTHAEEDRVVMPVSFARAQQQRRAFARIIQLRLEQVELPEDILNVRLEALRLVPWLGGNRQLFKLLPGDGEMSDPDSSELIDQLHARLGRGACARLAVIDQHAPESAWQATRPGRKVRQAAGRASADAPPGRPLWLFDPPRPADPQRLTLIRGPERIQTAWWQQAIWRDYYVASLENGARCWAFVDARNDWYLHGYFG